MNPRLKKAGLILLDLCLLGYLVVAFSAFNKPEENLHLCTDVKVVVADATTNGFIDANEVVNRLKKSGLYPKGKPLARISCRQIEETLAKTPFVKTAECYKNQDGVVNVSITQRMPIVRIKAINNDDFYVDDQDCIMPNSQYTSDLIIATGYINRSYATAYVSPLARILSANDLYRNLFEQINITRNMEVELVPRIGDHIVFLGRLPQSNSKSERFTLINDFINTKLHRLELFYKHGLPVAGWNKYSEISLEFDNQIICKRRNTEDD